MQEPPVSFGGSTLIKEEGLKYAKYNPDDE